MESNSEMVKFTFEENEKITLVDDDRLMNRSGSYKRYSKLKRKSLRPYYIWREDFMKDRLCSKKDVAKEFFIASIPHILLNLLLIAYIGLGGILFRMVDITLSQETISNAFLFSFTTITTIGYGNVVPTTFYGKLTCVFYCIIGIPLMFLVLKNNGMFVAEGYWLIRKSISKKQELIEKDTLPCHISLILLLIHSTIGAWIFSQWIDDMPTISALYFSFISISTIGYGDLTPTPENFGQVLIIMIYMTVGIVILSTFTGELYNYLTAIQHLGRNISDASEVEVWFGGQVLTVGELVSLVAEQFQVSPDRLYTVLRDLDAILTVACDDSLKNRQEKLLQTGELIRNESVVMLEDHPSRSVVISRENSRHFSGRHPSGRSIQLSKVSSNSSINKLIARDNAKALQALGVIHHTWKNQSIRRSKSSPASSRNAVRRNSPPSEIQNQWYNLYPKSFEKNVPPLVPKIILSTPDRSASSPEPIIVYSSDEEVLTMTSSRISVPELNTKVVIENEVPEVAPTATIADIGRAKSSDSQEDAKFLLSIIS